MLTEDPLKLPFDLLMWANVGVSSQCPQACPLVLFCFPNSVLHCLSSTAIWNALHACSCAVSPTMAIWALGMSLLKQPWQPRPVVFLKLLTWFLLSVICNVYFSLTGWLKCFKTMVECTEVISTPSALVLDMFEGLLMMHTSRSGLLRQQECLCFAFVSHKRG